MVASIRPPVEVTEADASSVVPSARSSFTVPEMVEAETCTIAPCPAVPANVILAFWPGMVVVTVVAGPPAVTDAVTSAGTMNSDTTMLPVFTPFAWAWILYVPVEGSVTGSPQPPPVPKAIEVPSGWSDGSVMSSAPDLMNVPAIL